MENPYVAYVGDKEITVQALRVSGKKMTLQFFRQIPKSSYFMDDAEIDASLIPWGRVIYSIANEGKSWVVAQKGVELFRCCIDLPSTSEWSIDHHTKGIAETTEKISRKTASDTLLKMYEETFARHTAGLREATEKLRIARKKAAALSQLDTLPQLYLA